MTLAGLKDLLAFLDFLKEERIWYRVEHLRFDALTVEIHLVGVRLEVEFFADHIEYSHFDGDESVHDDQKRLFEILKDLGT